MKILFTILALIFLVGFISVFSHVVAMTTIERTAWFSNHPGLEFVMLFIWPISIFGGICGVWFLGKKR